MIFTGWLFHIPLFMVHLEYELDPLEHLRYAILKLEGYLYVLHLVDYGFFCLPQSRGDHGATQVAMIAGVCNWQIYWCDDFFICYLNFVRMRGR